MNSDHQHIVISHGPQFNGIISKIAMFLGLGSMVIFVWNINEGNYNGTFIYPLITITAIPFFLDIHGLELDLIKSRVRYYFSLFGIKIGTWHEIKSYQHLDLRWSRIAYRSGTQMLPGPIIIGSKRSNDSYTVYLESEVSFPSLEMGDFETQREAQIFMLKYASILGLPYFDHYQKTKESAASRRKEIENRRRR